MTRPPVDHVANRGAFDALLATATNYERMPEFHAGRVRVDLSRMREYCKRLAHVERAVPTIHVTGTKGKGSTSALVARVLACCEGRTGLHTSPHLHRMEERVLVDFEPIDEAGLLFATNQILRAGREEPALDFPTYFEFMTLVAFVRFAAERCVFAVHEVGMGGALDATNVVTPEVTAITNVALEHVAVLGDTIEKIAIEKSGIVKPGAPVLTGATGEALPPIERAAAAAGVPVYRLGRDFSVSSFAPTEHGFRATIRTWSGVYDDVAVDLPGRHQADNLALALGLLDVLRDRGRVRADRDSVRAALRGFRVPCRLEPIDSKPLTIVDGAHTPESIAAAAAALENHPATRRVALLGMARDKDVDRAAAALRGFDLVVATPYGNDRQTDPQVLAAAVARQGGKSMIANDPQEGLDLARHFADEDGLVLVVGSMYLAAAVRERRFGRDSALYPPLLAMRER